MRTVAIVGTSLAGLRAAETFRREGFDGRIVAIGAEPHLPVRPPAALEGAAARRLGARPASCCASRVSTTSTSTGGSASRAVALDVDAHEVELHDGERVAFDGLVIATGATPRRLPNQPNLAGVFTLRTLDDALALARAARRAARRSS